MAKEIFYTAVDMGSTKVCTIVAQVGTEGELKVLGTGLAPSQGVQKGRIENVEEARESVHQSLQEGQRYMPKGIISGVYGVISGSHISSSNTTVALDRDAGSITSQDLRQLLESSRPEPEPARELLHVIPAGYQVDGLSGVRNPTGLHANQLQLESHTVTGDAAAVRNTVKALTANRVSVTGLVLQSLASAEATLTGDEREMGVMLADIGGGTTDIVIFQYGNPRYTAVIPVGGDNLTRDLAVATRTPFRVAEEMKLKWGNAMPDLVSPEEEVVLPSAQDVARANGDPDPGPGSPRRVVRRQTLCEPLHLRSMELLKLIMSHIPRSGLRQLPPGGLVLTGGGAEMAGFCQLAEATIGGPVRLAHPDGIAGLPTHLKKPGFSAAVGAVLWGIKYQGESPGFRGDVRSRWARGKRPRADGSAPEKAGAGKGEARGAGWNPIRRWVRGGKEPAQTRVG